MDNESWSLQSGKKKSKQSKSNLIYEILIVRIALAFFYMNMNNI